MPKGIMIDAVLVILRLARKRGVRTRRIPTPALWVGGWRDQRIRKVWSLPANS